MHIQESKLQITMDLGLKSDLNVEVEIQPEPQGITLAAAVSASLVLDGVTRHAA
jgi:hypothetical protein